LGILPEKTLVLVGQVLDREMYPELSRIYTDAGGFYQFTLPDMRERFIVGISDEGKFLRGDGIIYYESVPPNPEPVSDIRQT
jgi:hypothetical protein